MLRLILPVTLAAGMTMIAPVSAAAAEEARTQVVSYRDLDLTRTVGVETLERRVRNAVRDVCGPADGLPLAERSAQWTCVRAAGSGAKVQVERAVRVAYMAHSLTTAQR